MTSARELAEVDLGLVFERDLAVGGGAGEEAFGGAHHVVVAGLAMLLKKIFGGKGSSDSNP